MFSSAPIMNLNIETIWHILRPRLHRHFTSWLHRNDENDHENENIWIPRSVAAPCLSFDFFCALKTDCPFKNLDPKSFLLWFHSRFLHFLKQILMLESDVVTSWRFLTLRTKFSCWFSLFSSQQTFLLIFFSDFCDKENQQKALWRSVIWIRNPKWIDLFWPKFWIWPK